MASVAVVGSINLDIVVQLPRRPEPGETLMGHLVGRFAGGKGMNQAVACYRSGVSTRFYGQVGSDPEGALLRQAFVQAGLDDAGLHVHPDLPSGIAQIAALPGGENSIVVVPGANLGLGTANAIRTLEAADVLLMQMEIDVEVVFASLSAARERGIKTILNAAPATQVDLKILSVVDVLIVNQPELEALGGLDSVLGKGPEHVVVTLGGEGAFCASSNGTRVSVAAYDVEVSDTTGAGDAFSGVLAGSLAEGSSFEVAMKRAAAAGAITASAIGAQTPELTSSAIARMVEIDRTATI